MVKQKVGPVSATFQRQGPAVGRGAGHQLHHHRARARAGRRASPRARRRCGSPTPDGGTLLSYDVTANVGGKLAQLGSRLIDGFAKKMADSFFNTFAVAVEAPAEPSMAEADPAAEKKPGWFRRLVGRKA